MAALGDERLFELLEADGRGHRRAATPRPSTTGASPSSSSAAPGPRSRSSSPTSASGPARRRPDHASTSGTRSGHAVEAAAGFGDLLHGEAVAYGLRAAGRIGVAVGRHAAGAGGADRRACSTRWSWRALPCPTPSTRSSTTSRPTRSTPAAACAGCCRPATGVEVRVRRPRRRSCATRRPAHGSPPGAARMTRVRVLVLEGPNLNLARHPRAGDLRLRDARRDPRRARERAPPSSGSTSTSSSRTTRARSSTGCTSARLRRGDRQRRRADPHERRPCAMRCSASSGRSSRSTCPTRRRREPFRHVNFLARHRRSSRSSGRARAAITWRSSRSPGATGARVADATDPAETAGAARACGAASTRSTGASSALLNERATLAREAGTAKAAAGRRAIRDAEREREVLLRVSMANEGPLPAGRPAGAVPAAVRRDPRARGARPRARRGGDGRRGPSTTPDR